MKHRLMAEGDASGAGGDAAAQAAAANGSGDKPWYSEAHKEYVTTKGWKTVDDALTSSINLEKLMGADRAGRTVVLPKDEQDVEGVKAFRAKLGIPLDATGYKVPDGLKDDPLLGSFAKLALDAGIPASGFDKVLNGMISAAQAQEVEAQNAAKASSAAELEKLKAEWGGEFDKNSEYARRFLRASGWDDAKMAKYESAFGTAAMLKDFHGWGSKTGEADFVAGGGSTAMTPSRMAVQKQIEAVRAARIAGTMTEAQFHAEMAILGPKLEAA